jgi:hypothetical protein
MTRTMYIDPKGRHGLRTTLRSLNTTRARIKKTDEGAQIEFSDGRITSLVKEAHVSLDTFIAAAVQWTRRRGVASIEIEI